MKFSKKYCNHCQKETKFETEGKKINHVLHLLLSVFTCGIWLIVWLFGGLGSLVFNSEEWTCSTCGDKYKKITKHNKILKYLLSGIIISISFLIIFHIILLSSNNLHAN